MLIIPPAQFRRRRGRAKGIAAAPPGAALVLIDASFDSAGLRAFLVFDRAISIAGLQPGQVQVADPFLSNLYVGDPAGGSVSGTVVTLLMDRIGSATGSAITLSASATTGIVAVNDGGTWVGASGLVLPFG